MSYPWIVYLFSPSAFKCMRCGTMSLIVYLPDTVVQFRAQFKTWAEPHFDCVVPP